MLSEINSYKKYFKGNMLFKAVALFGAILVIAAILFRNIIPAIIITVLLLGSRLITNFAWKKASDPLIYLISNLGQFVSFLFLFLLFPISLKPDFVFDLFWFISLFVVTGINIIIFALWEYKIWPKRIAEWEKIGKVNLAKGWFNVLAPWRAMSKKDVKIMNTSLYIIPIISGIFVLLTERLANGFQNAMIKLLIVILCLFFGSVVGQYITWIIKIHKLQREGANLRTEYSRML